MSICDNCIYMECEEYGNVCPFYEEDNREEANNEKGVKKNDT